MAITQQRSNGSFEAAEVSTVLNIPAVLEYIPLLLVLLFASAVIAAVGLSLRWPIGQDAPLLQYCAFLIDHGMVPYRDIIDMNGIGAYVSSWLAIHLLGYSDLGWRIYDLLFLALGACGIVMITRPLGRWAVALASCFFVIFHIQEGPLELGQRDFQLAVCALLGCGLVCEAIRRGNSLLLFASGVLFSTGSTIKLTGIVFLPVFFLVVIAVNWRYRTLSWSACSAILAGALVPWSLAALYLQRSGALSSFLDIVTNFLPIYATTGRVSLLFLAKMAVENLEALLVPVFLSGVLLFDTPSKNRRFELAIIAAGAVCGLLSYTTQGKAWWYHLDSFAAFLCVWCGISTARLVTSDRNVVRIAATAGAVVFLLLAANPVYSRPRQDYYFAPRTEGLEAEIARLRSAGHSRGIQIMDTAEGGIHALYDLQLVQATGFLYDFYFYASTDKPFVQGLRARFMKEMHTTQPDIVVIAMTSWPDRGLGMGRIDGWPELRTFFQTYYRQERQGDWYRIYIHN